MLESLALVQQPLIRESAADADVLIRPDLQEFSVFELDRVGELVARGRAAAEAVIPRVRARLAELSGRAEEPGQAAH